MSEQRKELIAVMEILVAIENTTRCKRLKSALVREAKKVATKIRAIDAEGPG